MTRIEFMDILQRTLAGSLNSSTVNENMRYYQEYFDTQMRMGKSEEEVIVELGNPRLLAKTIIEAAKREGRGGSVDAEYEEVYEDGTQTQGNKGGQGTDVVKNVRMPGWLIVIIVVLIFLVVVRIIGSVIIAFLPILVPAACVFFILRFLQNR